MRDPNEKIFVTRAFLPPIDEYEEKLKKIWDSAWLTNMGVMHEELKKRLGNYLKTDRIELFCNGHLALESIIEALNLDGEVITTPFSFASTTHAVVRKGLKPVFCDVRESDATLDPQKIRERITSRTCAILPVHVYGNICDVEEIEKIALEYGLIVIYDAAHAFGEDYKGRSVGSFGNASMFSFHATKVFHTIEGGAVTFSDPKLTDILYRLKNFGITGQENVEYAGGNAKMTEFQAAMGLCNLKYVDEIIKKRHRLCDIYEKLLSGKKGISLFDRNSDIDYNYAYMPVFFEDEKRRDEVFDRLSEHNIFARKYFFPCISEYRCYRDDFDSKQTPVAMNLSKRVLTLPLYAELDPDVVSEICDITVM